MGSFRLTTGKEHLHSSCNFAELIVETVCKSLCHSCRSDYIFRVNEFSSRVGKPLRSSMLQSYPDTSGGVGVDNLRARIQKVFHHIEFMVSFTCLACSL